MSVDEVDPEQVLVLETIGRLSDFQKVVRYIPGMEWLGEFDAEVVAADPGFLVDGTASGDLKAQLFVVASNRKAYDEVLRLWKIWDGSLKDKLPRPYGRLAEAFKYLNDVREWGPRDRVVSTGVIEYWERGLASNDPVLGFEVELWCRSDVTVRDAAYARLESLVSAVGGRCRSRAVITQIDYHGALIELPAVAVRQTLDAVKFGVDTPLLRLRSVKYFAPIGRASFWLEEAATVVTPQDRPLPTTPPVVALLDGLPLTNHASLRDRLVVDDPDDLASSYRVGENRHGTAMASLIIHAEYDGSEPALTSELYVRPIMSPGEPDHGGRREETFPTGELVVDLVHRAVRRMLESDGAIPAQAPGVKAINLSLGDAWQPFDRQMSPWARLLDWLAWKYQVLFVVSTGNHYNNIKVPLPASAIAAMSDVDLRAHTMRCIAEQRVYRRLLAPAESINALTVGALHAQSGPLGSHGSHVDLLRGAALASPLSTVASGFRRSVKPEILVPGGLCHYAPRLRGRATSNAEFEITRAAAQPGQLVAACHPTGASNEYATRICGSSNASALTTRRAAQLVEKLRELQLEPGGTSITDSRMAVALKAMLVHGASWNGRATLFDDVFDGPDNGMERWHRIKRACAQFLGYGPADFERGAVCTDQRVILLGCADLSAGQGHVYTIPLPPALNAQAVLRRLTITLAWFTPVNPRHRNYRIADLWFTPPESGLRVKRIDVDHDAVTRGTVQHEVLEGESPVPIANDDTMPVQVNCRADASMGIERAVPYALLVSLETAQPLAVSIYDQVKARIDALHAPVPIRPSDRVAPLAR